MARRTDHEDRGGIVRLTTRGEIVLATLATLALIAMMGVAGWIEGGMQ
jgi:hypothetical protein